MAGLEKEPDVYRAVEAFFKEAAGILLSPHAPCGCLVVLAAINVSADSTEVSEAIKSLRQVSKRRFAQRLKQGVRDGQLPEKTDVKSLAATLSTMLEGMSVHARDGLVHAELARIAAHAVRLLPSRSIEKA